MSDDSADSRERVLSGAGRTAERTEVSEHNDWSAELFATLARATFGETGAGYFDALARSLAAAFHADIAFVGQLTSDGRAVRTLSVWADGEAGEDMTYHLVDSPCETVIDGDACIYPAKVQELFPRDPLLSEMGVHGYCGMPVHSADGTPRGILVALFRSPLPAGLSSDLIRMTLDLFAARTAAEMDRVEAQAELERAKSELERRVAERTAELTAANRELDAFAHTVSHDLRAPVRHIAGFTELLNETAGDILPAEAQRHLGVIRGAARKMRQLIDDLLALSRTGSAALSPGPVELEPLVRAIVDALSRGRDVRWEIGALPVVYADPMLLDVVMHNLLDNAVKYSRDQSPPRVSVSCQARAEDWLIEVRDNGVGFDMKYADQLFGVFRRLHRDAEFEGTGIGLATVERIVTRHGGTVWAESEPGKGARFGFTLPRR